MFVGNNESSQGSLLGGMESVGTGTSFESPIFVCNEWSQLFTPDTIQVMYGENITRPDAIESVDFSFIKELIKSDKLKDRISTIRGTYFSYMEASNPEAHIWVPGQAEKLEEKYNALKRNLPWFCMTTYKSKRSTDSLLSITGYIIDIDHVAEPERLQEQIRDKILDAYFILRYPSVVTDKYDNSKEGQNSMDPCLRRDDNLVRVACTDNYAKAREVVLKLVKIGLIILTLSRWVLLFIPVLAIGVKIYGSYLQIIRIIMILWQV